MDKHQLKELIKETLEEIDLYSEDALNLLMGTCAQESYMGKYIKQLHGGPALGIFQIEPNTHTDHVNNFLRYKTALKEKIFRSCGIDKFDKDYLVFNLKYSICMARVHYLRVPHPLPTELHQYAKYYKKHYNTHLGKATEQQFIDNYVKYVF